MKISLKIDLAVFDKKYFIFENRDYNFKFDFFELDF